MNDILVKNFCTPPKFEITKFDLKSLAKANRTSLDFEGIQIPVYSRGEGKNVLLVHGWGSRASHLSLLANIIAGEGFTVYTFDSPAHSSENNIPSKPTSNLFEFGRSISDVASYIGNIYAVVAHSLGAIATLFTLAGFMKLQNYKFNTDKAVLLSSPYSVSEVISTYSKESNLTENEDSLLRKGLEDTFNFRIDDYYINNAIKNVKTEIMVIHDEDDEEVPVANAYAFKETQPSIKFYFTKGLGHRKILFNRDIAKIISNFIKDQK